MSLLISSLIVMGFLGLSFGIGLAYASRVFHVEVDPRVELVEEALPGANCGACGEPGCSGYAQAVVDGRSEPSLCAPGGPEVAAKVAEILGVDPGAFVPRVAVVQCSGGYAEAPRRADYRGFTSCAGAEIVAGGDKGCTYGCLGYGDCVAACSFDAMGMSDNGLPVVFEDACTACGACVEACPRSIITLVPKSQPVYLSCVSNDKAKDVKAVCSVGCTGCGLCAKAKTTPSGVLVMEDNRPIVPEVWDDFEGACQKCPTGGFVVRDPGEAHLSEALAAAAAGEKD